MKISVRKVISASLILNSLLTVAQNPASALFVKPAKRASGEISTTLHKPEGAYPWHNTNMTGFCIGVVEAKIKKPENLLQNTELQLKVDPIGKYFYLFPKRKNVNTFKLVGPSKKTDWYNIPEKIVNFILNRHVEVDYRLVEISSAQAKMLTAKPVKIGDKKQEIKINEGFHKEIEKVNGPSKAKKLSDALLEKALNGLNDPNVDPYDPYDVVGNGNIFKYADYKAPVECTNYYSKKEAEENNKKINIEKNKVCDELAKKSGEDLKGFGSIGTLSAEKPVKYFAIVVNNFIEGEDENSSDYKSEAYKTSQLLAYNGVGTFGSDKSLLEINVQKTFTMPEAGVPSDQEQIDKVAEEVKSTLAKPGFKQWTKNKIDYFWKQLEKFLPAWVADVVEIVGNHLKRKDDGLPLAKSENTTGAGAQQQPQAGGVAGQQQGQSMSAEFLQKASEIAMKQAETNRMQQEALHAQQQPQQPIFKINVNPKISPKIEAQNAPAPATIAQPAAPTALPPQQPAVSLTETESETESETELETVSPVVSLTDNELTQQQLSTEPSANDVSKTEPTSLGNRTKSERKKTMKSKHKHRR